MVTGNNQQTLRGVASCVFVSTHPSSTASQVMGTLRHGETWTVSRDWRYSHTTRYDLFVFFCWANLGDIKSIANSTTPVVLPPPIYLSFHSSTLPHLFIYLCQPALSPSTRFQSLSHPVMVASTRAKNKHAHPAAPVMTEAAKKKAGIKTKHRQKRVTKDETIRQLQAQIAALENPNEESFSKEPLVCVER